MEALTVEKILEAKRKIEEFGPSVSTGGLYPFAGPFMGFDIHENSWLTETEEYEVTVELTFYQRWIYPLLHGITEPFQPWVRTRVETRTRQKPSRSIFQMGNTLIMHPALRSEISAILSNVVA